MLMDYLSIRDHRHDVQIVSSAHRSVDLTINRLQLLLNFFTMTENVFSTFPSCRMEVIYSAEIN